MAERVWIRDKKRWTMGEALSLSLSQRLNMGTEERAMLANFLQGELKKRERQFARAKTKGFALTKLEDEWQVVKDFTGIDLHTPIMNRVGNLNYLSDEYAALRAPSNQLSSYISHLLDFFRAKSSTVKGWRQIGIEQDNRLFGRQYQSGRKAGQWYGAKVHLTDEERTNFWRLYHELYVSGWTGINDYSSESQREVASFFIKGRFNKDEDITRAVAAWKKEKGLLPESYKVESGTDSPFPLTDGKDIDETRIPWIERMAGGLKKWFLK